VDRGEAGKAEIEGRGADPDMSLYRDVEAQRPVPGRQAFYSEGSESKYSWTAQLRT
jgi:hypothetical protein